MLLLTEGLKCIKCIPHNDLKPKNDTVCVIKKKYLNESFIWLVFYQRYNDEL